MKNSIFQIALITASLFTISLKAQDAATPLYASVTTVDIADKDLEDNANDEKIRTSAATKEDVVINIDMIESFRRCYDKIEPFSLTDFFKGDPQSVSVKYLAYMRARLRPENIEVALASELKTVQTVLSQKILVNIASITYTEKSADVMVQNSDAAASDEPVVAKNHKVTVSKRVNGVKWILPKK